MQISIPSLRTSLVVAICFLASLSCNRPGPLTLESSAMRLEFDQQMRSRITALFDQREIAIGELTAAEILTLASGETLEFRLTASKLDEPKAGERRLTLEGTTGAIEKTVAITVSDEEPAVAVFRVSYRNSGDNPVAIKGWTNNHYRIDAGQGAAPAFWSFQPGSYEKRPDWVLPVAAGFEQRNYLGMNATDYGGGTPVVDVWRRDVGLAVGHLEVVPKLVSLPVSVTNSHAEISVENATDISLAPGETLETAETFVSVHRGDFYNTLRRYRRLMEKRGIQTQTAPERAFLPYWCAWGFGRDFKPGQVYKALPKVRELGFAWVTVDDGWQTAEGDWFLHPRKFPRGDADMRAMVDTIHKQNFHTNLWWAPLAADPGTTLLEKQADTLLLNRDGAKQDITWWDAYYMCPAYQPVVEYHRLLVQKMIGEWDYDGLKLDGQHMNGVPACYNPAHKHKRPEESVEALPKFFQMIYETAKSIKPDAVIEFCPCGTQFSSFISPFMDLSVASDPTSSLQVRQKAKTLKALTGDKTPYFGDHVELSDGGEDFASSVGVGAVIGTNFAWPPGTGSSPKVDLTPKREQIWAKWVKIYQDKMLSRGEYDGTLYDIGFDRPEAHVVRKDNKVYYGFFADSFDATLELRGLENRAYEIIDYVNDRKLGEVKGPTAQLKTQFDGYLLLEAVPRP